MSKKSVTAVIMMALVMSLSVVGCQQQRKPNHAENSKGLNPVYFDFDKSDIKSDSTKTLQDNAAWLKSNRDAKVTIAGNCDERGTEEYNMALGQRRATSAKSYLTSLGIDSSRLKTVSYGEEKPVETCHNESCWWKNRRDDFSK